MCGPEPYGVQQQTDKLNYWGIYPGQIMAPKAAYSSGGGKASVREFKEAGEGSAPGRAGAGNRAVF